MIFEELAPTPILSVISYVCLYILEDMARYAGLLRAPAEGFSQKKRAYYAVLANFLQFLVPSKTLVPFSSNLSNFERNPPPKKTLKNPKGGATLQLS